MSARNRYRPWFRDQPPRRRRIDLWWLTPLVFCLGIVHAMIGLYFFDPPERGFSYFVLGVAMIVGSML